MEVHHPHHPTHKKKWSEYIIEFVMLFAAVTLGFFAENLREHQVIENHKNQNLISMFYDLKQDSIVIEKRIEEYRNSLLQFERIKDLSFAYQHQEIKERQLIDSLVSRYLKLGEFGNGLYINNASYRNTISSGSLSYINDNDTKKMIAQYYEALYGRLVVNNKILDEDTNEFMNKTFVFGFTQKNTNELEEGQTRSNLTQIEDFKTIPTLRNILIAPEFRMSINKIEGRYSFYIYLMRMTKELNNKLLFQLNQQLF